MKPNTTFIKTLQIVYFFFIVSIITFSLYVSYWQKETLFFSFTEGKTFLYIAILVAFTGNLAGKFMYNKLIREILLNHSLTEKKSKYITASIVRAAMLEIPAFMCVAFTSYSNNSFYFILVAILLLMFVVSFPTKNKFIQEVPLKGSEKLNL